MANKLIDCDNIEDLTKYAIGSLGVSTYSRSLFFKCFYENVGFVIKIMFYHHIPAQILGVPIDPSLKSQSEIELICLRMLRDKIINTGISPCIIELLSSKTCEGVLARGRDYTEEDLDKKTGSSQYLDILRFYIRRVYLNVQDGIADDKITVVMLEHAGITLDRYMQIIINDAFGELVIKGITFMIIYTLYAIDRQFPGMLHRDLHLANIMLLHDPDFLFTDKFRYLHVVFDKKHHYIPFLGLVPKIIDFGFAKIPSMGIESNIVLSKEMIQSFVINDVAVYFKYLYFTAQKQGLLKIVNLINALSPAKYHSSRLNQKTGAEPVFPSFQELLSNDVFSEYRVAESSSHIYKRYELPDK